MPATWTFRRMRAADLDQIMAIEEASFKSPWSRQSFEAELAKEYGYPLVAIDGGHVIGYLIQWFVADEIHIANIAVHPQWRRQGVAEAMLQHILQEAQLFSWVGLEVRRSNYAARAL